MAGTFGSASRDRLTFGFIGGGSRDGGLVGLAVIGGVGLLGRGWMTLVGGCDTLSCMMTSLLAFGGLVLEEIVIELGDSTGLG